MDRKPVVAGLKYAAAVTNVCIATAANYVVPPLHAAPYLLIFGTIVLHTWYGGRGAGWIAFLTGLIASWYVIFPPSFSFVIGPEQGLQLAGFALVAALIVAFTGRAHRTLTREIEERKQAETQSSRHQKELADFVENASIGLHWVGEDGRILWANQAELDMVGYGRAEYIGRHIAEFHPDEPVIQDVLRRLTTGEEIHGYEMRLRCKDGTIKYVSVSSNALYQNGRFVHTRCFSQDITDRKLGERLVAHQKRALELIAQGALLGIVLETLTRCIEGEAPDVVASILLLGDDGRRLRPGAGPRLPNWYKMAMDGLVVGPETDTWWSRAYREETVITEDIHSHLWWRHFAHLARDTGLVACWTVPIWSRESQVLGTFGIYFRHPRGPTPREREVVQVLAPTAAIAIERERRDAEIRESEARKRAVLESALDCIITMDEGGRIIEFNPAAEATFDYRAADVLGRTVNDTLMPSRLQEAHRQGLAQFLESGRTQVLGRCVMMEARRADGTEFPCEVSVTCTKLRNGRRIFTTYLRDITERLRAERSLKEMNEWLEQRVEERTRSLVQHQSQLRILASELTLVEQRERRRLATDLHDYLAQMLVVCRMKLGQAVSAVDGAPAQPLLENIGDVLDNCLNYTRTLVSALSPTVLYEFGLPAALKVLAEQMERYGLHVTVEGTDLSVRLSEEQAVLLYQTVRELLFNVLKHAETDRATVGLQRTEAELIVTVADQGLGFSPDAVFQQKSTVDKFGLLSIRERLKAMGGRFSLESAPGQGTLATLAVDRPAEAPESAAPSAAVQMPFMPADDRPDRIGGIRILLVDDHPLVREGLRSCLEANADFLVVGEAADGEQAVEMARTLRPNVIIMDINLPKLNGIEATRRIRQEHRSVTVIGLSVHEEAHVRAALHEAGSAAFVTKGTATDDLCRLIREHRCSAEQAATRPRSFRRKRAGL